MNASNRAGEEATPSDDPMEVLRYVTQKTRLNILQDIIGHPQASPSPKELDYMNPSVNASTISEHLNGLEERGVIDRIKVPDYSPYNSPQLPKVFCALTPWGRELLEQYNILVDEEADIKRDYESVEKPEEIVIAEEMPRPHLEPGAHESSADAQETIQAAKAAAGKAAEETARRHRGRLAPDQGAQHVEDVR